MPDIIRLRTSGNTTSVIKRRGAVRRRQRFHDMRLHDPGDCLDYRDDNGIPELTVGLGIGDADFEA